MEYYNLNGVICSTNFGCCGQPCFQAAGGDRVIKKGEESCFFVQDPPTDTEAADRARMACPAGAITRQENGLENHYNFETHQWELRRKGVDEEEE